MSMETVRLLLQGGDCSKPANQLEVSDTSSFVSGTTVFYCIFVLFKFCSPHLIGPSKPVGPSDDIRCPRRYCGVLYITSSLWDLPCFSQYQMFVAPPSLSEPSRVVHDRACGLNLMLRLSEKRPHSSIFCFQTVLTIA